MNNLIYKQCEHTRSSLGRVKHAQRTCRGVARIEISWQPFLCTFVIQLFKFFDGHERLAAYDEISGCLGSFWIDWNTQRNRFYGPQVRSNILTNFSVPSCSTLDKNSITVM